MRQVARKLHHVTSALVSGGGGGGGGEGAVGGMAHVGDMAQSAGVSAMVHTVGQDNRNSSLPTSVRKNFTF